MAHHQNKPVSIVIQDPNGKCPLEPSSAVALTATTQENFPLDYFFAAPTFFSLQLAFATSPEEGTSIYYSVILSRKKRNIEEKGRIFTKFR